MGEKKHVDLTVKLQPRLLINKRKCFYHDQLNDVMGILYAEFIMIISIKILWSGIQLKMSWDKLYLIFPERQELLTFICGLELRWHGKKKNLTTKRITPAHAKKKKKKTYGKKNNLTAKRITSQQKE